MSFINGKLESILNNEPEKGTVILALCGFGGQIPRFADDAALMARVTTQEITVAIDGTFTLEVPGNDLIEPTGTYYTVTVKDSNGDTIQINAYVFLGDNTYDLETTPPFDPTLPMMPLPPLILDELHIVSAFDTMIFDGTFYTAFKTTLHSNVLHPAFVNMKPGHLYTFIILQDNLGGWQFVWGSTVHNGTMIALDQYSQTVQTFIADQDGQLYAISGGAYS